MTCHTAVGTGLVFPPLFVGHLIYIYMSCNLVLNVISLKQYAN